MDNKDIIKEQHKKYRENNKDKIKERNKKYRENNGDKYKEYREINKDKIKEKRKTKILCICGRTITKHIKAKHERTHFHIFIVNNLPKKNF